MRRKYKEVEKIEDWKDEKIEDWKNEKEKKYTGKLRRIQENAKRYLKAQKDARRHKKVIATELTVNSSISTLGMVYTLL